MIFSLICAIVLSSRRDPSCHPHSLPGRAFEAARSRREILHSVRVLLPSHLSDGQLQWLPMADLVHLSMVQGHEPPDRTGGR